jgi:hypothetical protein
VWAPAGEDLRGGVKGGRQDRQTQASRSAPVNEAGRQTAISGRYDDVAGFDVAVNDAGGAQNSEARSHLGPEPADGEKVWPAVRADVTCQLSAVGPSEDLVGSTVPFPGPQESGQVRMGPRQAGKSRGRPDPPQLQATRRPEPRS